MKQKCFWGIIVLSFFIIIVFGVQVEQYLEILFALIFDDNTGAEFVRNIFIAFFSIALGIPAGLEINRRWHNKQDRQRQIQLLAIAQDWRTPEEYFRIFLGGNHEQGVQSVRETAPAIVYGRIQAGCGQSCCR